MKLSLRSRIYLGILPLLLLFLGLMYFLILDVRGLYNDTQEISFAGIDINRSLSEVEQTLSELSYILEEGTGFRNRDRDFVSLNRLSRNLGKTSEEIELAALQTKLNKLMFDIGTYDVNLRDIQKLALDLSEGRGDAKDLYDLVAETRQWTIRIQELLQEYLSETKEKIEDRVEVVYFVVIGGMLIGILLTLLISTTLWKRIIQPIEEISEGMREYRSDTDPLEIDYHQEDELGKLARSLEQMTAHLQQYQELTNKKLIRSTSALRSILDQSPDAFFIFSDEMVPTYHSPVASRLYLNSPLKKELPTEVTERFNKTLATGEPQVSKEITEAIRIQVDDEEKWYLVHAFPFDAPDTKNFTDYSSDSNKHSIAAIFQEATVLKLADSLRKNLLATVSHELKTPITSARMSLYLLLEQKLGTLNEDQIDLLETARDDVNRQLATIENLLDLSKIEENIDHFDLSEFSCCEMVEESILAHTELASSHSIDLHYNPPKEKIYLLADRNKLRIVLNNFIVNAVKYSGHGSRVEISAEEKDQVCRIAVKDDGPGMDEETVRKIFDAYTRGGDPTAVKGTGLGLKISKDIIDGHGGQIGCQSKLGEGSTFFFELPLERTGGTS